MKPGSRPSKVRLSFQKVYLVTNILTLALALPLAICTPIVSTDAKHSPQGVIGSDITGVRNATSTSATDALTREHRMTLDEAHLILNAKRGAVMEAILKARPCNI